MSLTPPGQPGGLCQQRARLFAILRAHDADTIVGGEGTVAAARELARLKRDVFGWLRRSRITSIESASSPGKERAWYAASVRELLL